ncbi:hypothetical protein CPB84DRAFT_1775314 [Gymnopilus junonius]|uniref:Uncharacterized protein n=1 Tax=Gymnopilus junonius TaxID=109634 RepID=A0A9P5TQ67_GYMJU|nr:hypothetical protein CPB84DRAFT_1775314 [Gymnopilus junonius]
MDLFKNIKELRENIARRRRVAALLSQLLKNLEDAVAHETDRKLREQWEVQIKLFRTSYAETEKDITSIASLGLNDIDQKLEDLQYELNEKRAIFLNLSAKQKAVKQGFVHLEGYIRMMGSISSIETLDKGNVRGLLDSLPPDDGLQPPPLGRLPPGAESLSGFQFPRPTAANQPTASTSSGISSVYHHRTETFGPIDLSAQSQGGQSTSGEDNGAEGQATQYI